MGLPHSPRTLPPLYSSIRYLLLPAKRRSRLRRPRRDPPQVTAATPGPQCLLARPCPAGGCSYTHARTRARARAHTHTHTHTAGSNSQLMCLSITANEVQTNRWASTSPSRIGCEARQRHLPPQDTLQCCSAGKKEGGTQLGQRVPRDPVSCSN